jgi:hypothetical protein
MSFYERYELVDLTRDGAVKTFSARQKSTRREVSVHLLSGAGQAQRSLLDRLIALPGPAKTEILDTGDFEGATYIVTRPWLRRESFVEWVESGWPGNQEDKSARAGTWRIPLDEFGRKSAEPPATQPGHYLMFQTTGTSATPPIPEPDPPFPAPNPEPEPTRPDPAPVVARNTPVWEAENHTSRSAPIPDDTATMEIPAIDLPKKSPATAGSGISAQIRVLLLTLGFLLLLAAAALGLIVLRN